jgi:hypothetical protein
MGASHGQIESPKNQNFAAIVLDTRLSSYHVREYDYVCATWSGLWWPRHAVSRVGMTFSVRSVGSEARDSSPTRAKTSGSVLCEMLTGRLTGTESSSSPIY